MSKLQKYKLLANDGHELEEIFGHLEKRFGIDRQIFHSYEWIKGSKGIWLAPIGTWEFVSPKLKNGQWVVDKIGLRALKGRSFPYWPTNALLQTFHTHLKKGQFPLSQNELEQYLAGEIWDKELDWPHGPIAVTYQNKLIGAALYADKKITSFYPKALSEYYGYKKN